MHDIILMRFDGSLVVCFQGIQLEEVHSIIDRWDSREEGAAIIVWPTGVPIPDSNLAFAS